MGWSGSHHRRLRELLEVRQKEFRYSDICFLFLRTPVRHTRLSDVCRAHHRMRLPYVTHELVHGL